MLIKWSYMSPSPSPPPTHKVDYRAKNGNRILSTQSNLILCQRPHLARPRQGNKLALYDAPNALL